MAMAAAGDGYGCDYGYDNDYGSGNGNNYGSGNGDVVAGSNTWRAKQRNQHRILTCAMGQYGAYLLRQRSLGTHKQVKTSYISKRKTFDTLSGPT